MYQSDFGQDNTLLLVSVGRRQCWAALCEWDGDYAEMVVQCVSGVYKYTPLTLLVIYRLLIKECCAQNRTITHKEVLRLVKNEAHYQ